MRVTLDLSDELMRTVKAKAAEKDLKLSDFVTDLLRQGLSAVSAGRPTIRNRVEFPLVKCAHPARPDDELTPDRVAVILARAEESEPSGFGQQSQDDDRGSF